MSVPEPLLSESELSLPKYSVNKVVHCAYVCNAPVQRRPRIAYSTASPVGRVAASVTAVSVALFVGCSVVAVITEARPLFVVFVVVPLMFCCHPLPSSMFFFQHVTSAT